MGARPIIGTETERKTVEAEEKKTKAQNVKSLSANIAVQDITRALNYIDDSPMATGIPYGLTQEIPGSPANKLKYTFIEPIKAKISLDSLQKMRESSPTGGALGNVSDAEGERLASAYGSLNPVDPNNLKLNMQRLSNIYMDTIHGTPEQIQEMVNKGEISAQAAAPLMARYKLPFDQTGQDAPIVSNKKQFDVLPSGSVYINAKDKKPYRKP